MVQLGHQQLAHFHGQGDRWQWYFVNSSSTITTNPYAATGTDAAGSLSATANGGSSYFTPQNGGTTPTDADRSRYATITFRDYQKDTLTTVKDDTDLQNLLDLSASEIEALIDDVNAQLTATDGTGGIPSGFVLDQGDINGDGTGDGGSSGLPSANHLGNVVKIELPEVRLIGSTSITTQVRQEIFTVNDRGQTTTHTDAEGNLTVYVRYPENDSDGDGDFVSLTLSSHQYGRMKEIHVDADPDDVMSLVGSDGDLVDFVSGIITRSNTAGVYQDLVTRYEGDSRGAGSCTAAVYYDPLGNPLSETDARGFTRYFERNELGEVFRSTSPVPYQYQVETYYDANRNITRSICRTRLSILVPDPTDATYAQFIPTGSGVVANVPSQAGSGGSIRTGWFTNLTEFDLLDNRIEEDVDATGSDPDGLVTTFGYDADENLIQVTKPAGNTVQFDYDERDLQIARAAATRLIRRPSQSPPLTATVIRFR